MIAAIDAGFFRREIADAAFAYQREVDAKRKLIVGVNAFEETDEKPIETLTVERRREGRPGRARSRHQGCGPWALRDAGMHVIYSGLWQSPEAVVRTVAEEDADWLGLSLLSGADLTLVPRILTGLKEAGLDRVGVLVGGIIPERDMAPLTS